MEIIFYFIHKAIDSNASLKVFSNAEILQALGSPLHCLFSCASWTASPETRAVVSGTSLCVSKPQKAQALVPLLAGGPGHR